MAKKKEIQSLYLYAGIALVVGVVLGVLLSGSGLTQGKAISQPKPICQLFFTDYNLNTRGTTLQQFCNSQRYKDGVMKFEGFKHSVFDSTDGSCTGYVRTDNGFSTGSDSIRDPSILCSTSAYSGDYKRDYGIQILCCNPQ
ncbi:hypothetical protein HZB02_02610 [Candidatus Woesearchaeota archaeon]|nr:hypothetical protein [Candidatus Woesearchaeota archaeon]